MIKLAAAAGAGLARLWLSTVRTVTDSQGQRTDPWDPMVQENLIYAMWHENLFFVPTVRAVKPLTILISQSKDGELGAQITRFFPGVRTIRGSSNKGGEDAVEEVMRLAAGQTHFLVAPDGPRGPRREVKRGLAYMAAWSGLAIVPLGFGFSSAWRLKSWDRMAIPKPWSKMYCIGGPVIRVPPRTGKAGLEQYRRLIEQTMLTATAAAEAWAAGRKPRIDWPSLAAPAA
jgi:lysophospholipid acyltransferase (LPLAT)-like uncharacterized protein